LFNVALDLSPRSGDKIARADKKESMSQRRSLPQCGVAVYCCRFSLLPARQPQPSLLTIDPTIRAGLSARQKFRAGCAKQTGSATIARSSRLNAPANGPIPLQTTLPPFQSVFFPNPIPLAFLPQPLLHLPQLPEAARLLNLKQHPMPPLRVRHLGPHRGEQQPTPQICAAILVVPDNRSSKTLRWSVIRSMLHGY